MPWFKQEAIWAMVILAKVILPNRHVNMER